nr:LUD domain-containing protein [Flavilitoribacter sp.]
MNHAQKASAFIRDEVRTDWHNQAVWHLRQKRDLGAGSVPEWEELRNLASAIKFHALSNLDDYLVQFEANARANGVQVHWAATAEDHNRIVYGILAEHGVKKMVKSKSMLTEDCHLNPYLEIRGIEVIDTDLGERIIQMRHEPPSHIVAPAIHIRKEEVGELFHKELGTEAGASDPKYLTEAARGHLRGHF